MIWPAMLYNLCVGLLFAGYLLRAVRRFERTADRIEAKMDATSADQMRKYDQARDDIRVSLETLVDVAITELDKAFPLAETAGLEGALLNATTLSHEVEYHLAKEKLYDQRFSLPYVEVIDELPRWARVAFAARCARRVLPLYKHFRPLAQPRLLNALYLAVDLAERAFAPGSELPSKGTVYEDSFSVQSGDIDSKAATNVSDCVWQLADSFSSTATPAEVSARLASAIRHAFRSATRILDITHYVRADFETVRNLVEANSWTDDTPVLPAVFGPLWPEGSPAGWPEPESPTTEIVLEFDIPDDTITVNAVAFAKKLAAELSALHVAGGGHGLAIRPPLNLEAPVPARVPDSPLVPV